MLSFDSMCAIQLDQWKCIRSKPVTFDFCELHPDSFVFGMLESWTLPAAVWRLSALILLPARHRAQYTRTETPIASAWYPRYVRVCCPVPRAKVRRCKSDPSLTVPPRAHSAVQRTHAPLDINHGGWDWRPALSSRLERQYQKSHPAPC